VSLLVFVLVAFVFAGLAAVVREDARVRTALGLIGLIVALVAALLMDPAQSIEIGGGGIATTPYLRLFLILGSLVGLGLAVSGIAGGSRRDAPAVTLAILAACGLTLALVDPRSAVLVATAGGLFGVLVTLIPGNGRAGATVGIRETRAVVVSGALAIAATAWFGRDLSQLAAQPVVFGLAYLAFAVAVAMRFGAIPFHLWAARLTDVVPETALPILTAMAPASLAIVALAWTDASVAPLLVDVGAARMLVVAIAIASIVLAAIAAFVQDDLEHVLGYSIVGDAGVVMLALATLDPEAWAPARTWILVFVVARSAFAAWVAGIRAGFWTGRIADLRGWVWRSPLLAVAFALVVIASIGFPGLVAFDARLAIVDLALDPPLATIVLVATLLPLVYYGRLATIGLARPDRAIDPRGTWLPRITRPARTGIGGWIGTSWEINRAFTTAAVAVVLGLLALATSAGGFGGPEAAAGLPPSLEAPGEIVSPIDSNDLPLPVESVEP
jgi:NADH:ubiquinone oxidoreductase subunit 2 (subunit N)